MSITLEKFIQVRNSLTSTYNDYKDYATPQDSQTYLMLLFNFLVQHQPYFNSPTDSMQCYRDSVKGKLNTLVAQGYGWAQSYLNILFPTYYPPALPVPMYQNTCQPAPTHEVRTRTVLVEQPDVEVQVPQPTKSVLVKSPPKAVQVTETVPLPQPVTTSQQVTTTTYTQPAVTQPVTTTTYGQSAFNLPPITTSTSQPAFNLPPMTSTSQPAFNLPTMTTTSSQPAFNLPPMTTTTTQPAFNLPPARPGVTFNLTQPRVF